MCETLKKEQLLYLVFGGELKNIDSREFRDVGNLDIVGIFPDYASALAAWKAKVQASVDNALQCYRIASIPVQS